MLTLFGASAVAVMLLAYALEHRSAWWVLVFALACAASSVYGWLAGTWPFGVVEGVWAVVAFRRWLQSTSQNAPSIHGGDEWLFLVWSP
jgi:hypothetical protein